VCSPISGAEHGLGDSHGSVKRSVRMLKAKEPTRVWSIECDPGKAAQLDLGPGAPFVDEQGKGRRTRVLRVVLSHSRIGYSEAVPRQDKEMFLRWLEPLWRPPQSHSRRAQARQGLHFEPVFGVS
jgi:hypothetical protein